MNTEASKPLENISVLIVEDEVAIVTLLRYNLEREGFRVAEARDGEEALLLAREPVAWGETPDVLTPDNLAKARIAAESWTRPADICAA